MYCLDTCLFSLFLIKCGVPRSELIQLSHDLLQNIVPHVFVSLLKLIHIPFQNGFVLRCKLEACGWKMHDWVGGMFGFTRSGVRL